MIQTIPEAAFLEAMANALVHRNWSVSGNIQVRMYPDYIEINSPGGLPAGVGEEDYFSDSLSVARNQALAYVFFRLGLIEKLGTGIQRIQRAYENAIRKPEFKLGKNVISVRLPLLNQLPELTLREKNVFEIMVSRIAYTRQELESITGLTKAQIAPVLRSLSDKNLIEISGKSKNTRYMKY